MFDYLINLLIELLGVDKNSNYASTIEVSLKVIVSLGIMICLYKFITVVVPHLFKNKSFVKKSGFKEIIFANFFIKIFSILIFFIVVAVIFGEDFLGYLKILFNATKQPFLKSGNTEISLFTLIMLVCIFFISSWLGKFIYKFFDTSVFPSSFFNQKTMKKVYLGNLRFFLDPDDARTVTVKKIVRYGISIFIFILGLPLIGVDLSSIAVILGVLGIGLGFGLQNFVANVFAGFVILFTKPIKEGDFITVGTNNGTVTKINTVSTIVTTKLNETIIVPNSVLISDVIFNNTYSDRTIIIKNSVMVSYDTDIDYIRSLLVSIANRSPYTMDNDEPEARISSFERTGIDMVLYSTAKEVYDRGMATAWINFEIWKEFKEKGIKIPVAFIDVNIK